MLDPATDDDFDKLGTAEKILRLQDLWDRIAADPAGIRLTAAQQEELRRRLDAYRAGQANGSEWAEVRERVRRRK